MTLRDQLLYISGDITDPGIFSPSISADFTSFNTEAYESAFKLDKKPVSFRFRPHVVLFSFDRQEALILTTSTPAENSINDYYYDVQLPINHVISAVSSS